MTRSGEDDNHSRHKPHTAQRNTTRLGTPLKNRATPHDASEKHRLSRSQYTPPPPPPFAGFLLFPSPTCNIPFSFPFPFPSFLSSPPRAVSHLLCLPTRLTSLRDRPQAPRLHIRKQCRIPPTAKGRSLIRTTRSRSCTTSVPPCRRGRRVV